jgi:hypothetical protein
MAPLLQRVIAQLHNPRGAEVRGAKGLWLCAYYSWAAKLKCEQCVVLRLKIKGLACLGSGY